MYEVFVVLGVALAPTPGTVAALERACERAGPVGILAEPSLQKIVQDAATALQTKSHPTPARVELRGTYQLLYSAAKGGSNGKVGPFVGKVTQLIQDDEIFFNQVALFAGLLTVKLKARREILDDQRIRVSFIETTFSILGREVNRQPTKGEGVWEQLYVEQGSDGTAALRVMKTPSLFVLRQV